MVRSPCCDQDNGLKRGPWTQEEDEKLISYIKNHGDGNWRALPKNADLKRCGKSCRLRWTNYLRPGIKRGRFSEEEEDMIIKLHSVLGNKWSRIATHLPGRTDNEIKNYWNTNLKKKLLQKGIDPVTHRPRSDLSLVANLSELVSMSMNSNHPYDINALRLQSNAAELAKIQLLQSVIHLLSSSSSSAPSINNSTPPLGHSPYVNNQLGSLNTTGVLNEISPVNCAGASLPARSETEKPGADLESWGDQYGGKVAQEMEGMVKYEQGVSRCDQIGAPAEGELPGLVSDSSTGTLSNLSVSGNSGDGSIFQSIGDYDLVDGWEKLIDDGNSDSFWRDLFIQ